MSILLYYKLEIIELLWRMIGLREITFDNNTYHIPFKPLFLISVAVTLQYAFKPFSSNRIHSPRLMKLLQHLYCYDIFFKTLRKVVANRLIAMEQPGW